MTPVTPFAVKDSYTYLEGFGSYHQSEAFPGANPAVINSPQKPPYGLVTERISGSSFTAPRNQNLQTWMYRATSSLDHGDFVPYEDSSTPNPPTSLTPNSYMWTNFPVTKNADWTSQRLLARNGEPTTKTGLAIWLFSAAQDMKPQTCMSSLDGDSLIIPQSGALDIQTELGRLLVRQNEIAVIPRGIRYRVTLPSGPTRGYICELFQGHFRLPDLGVIGSTGLANVRDFQIPTAHFDGSLDSSSSTARANNAEWTIISRMGGRLWSCTQDHTPFDVAGWHGTFYPYKYDLARFCVLGNMLFDEHDPSLYTVLTAPSNRSEPGTAVVDFAIIPPRWNVSEDTLWLPYYHRNIMNEFYCPIINNQDPSFPLNGGQEFKPFGAGLNGLMTAHGATPEELENAQTMDLRPKKLMDEGITLFLLETELPLYVSDWAEQSALKNFKAMTKKRSESKI